MFQVLFIALWLWFNGRTVILLWSIVTVKSVYNNIHFFLHEWYLQPFPFDIPLCLISFYCFLWSKIAVFGSKWIFVYILELPILLSKALLFLCYIQVKWFRFLEKLNCLIYFIVLFQTGYVLDFRVYHVSWYRIHFFQNYAKLLSQTNFNHLIFYLVFKKKLFSRFFSKKMQRRVKIFC